MTYGAYCTVAAVRAVKVVLSLRCLLLFFTLLPVAGVSTAADMEITPFGVLNQSPLIQIYGLPHDTGADIVPPGKFRVALNQDLSSNYSVSSGAREQVTLDGETYRLTLAARYGVAPRFEAGIEIPYIVQGGGFLDSFVVDWHNTFGLPQGGRNSAPKDRLNYSYTRDGVRILQMDHTASGIGDIALTGGYHLYDVSSTESHERMAIKGMIKLPTGNSSYLFGSGSTDVILQLCSSKTNYSEWGSLGVYGSIGALVMSGSDVLRDQHNPLAGVGSLGFGWGPTPWISFKLQLNGTTPMYRDSSLAEISRNTLILTSGGTIRLPGEYLLDIGVVEDVAVATAPDVSFHLGLSKRF